MDSELERLTRDYRTAFLRYLPRRGEDALAAGYELGRRAVADGHSPLDVARVHHVVLAEVVADTPTPQLGDLVAAAGEFVLEVLATFDMAHRVHAAPVRPRARG